MIHVLRTRSPVYSSLRTFSLDLHVLGTPPAFVLSQDQTLQLSSDSSLPAHPIALLAFFSPIGRYFTQSPCGRSATSSSIAIQFSKTEPTCRPSDFRPALPRL